MDEAREKGGSLSVATESSLTVSETAVETMVCDGQIPLEEGGEEGPSNGDDIMVEVLGSHVYVDGICTTDGGDGGMIGTGLNDEEVHGPGDSGGVGMEVTGAVVEAGEHMEHTNRTDEGEGDANKETDKQGADSEQRYMEVDIPHCSSENHAGNGQSIKAAEKVDLSRGAAVDVEKQVPDSKNVGFDADKDVKVEEKSVEIEAVGVGSEDHEASKADNNVLNQVHSSHSLGNEDPPAGSSASKDDARVAQDMNVEEQVTSDEHDSSNQLQEMEVEEHDSDPEQLANFDEKIVKRMSLRSARAIKVHQARYRLPPEEEGELSVSDLVWGKVRSHPWWPGQIFDPSDASEKAVKYHKKDNYLVAYFGDRTFAWNETSVLKPFRPHFSQIEKQSNSESFQNAVDCALEEVSRRTELGLACSCIPQDVFDRIKSQKVENAGVRQESSITDVVDESLSAGSFEPDKLVDYMKALAESPAAGGDRLDLVIAKAQLLAFYRLKGYHQLPEFQSCGDLSENETNTSHSEEKMHFGQVIEHGTPMDTDGEQISSGQETSKTKRSYYLKRKHNLKDGLYPSKKERSLTELMGETFDSPDTENGIDGLANKLPSSSFGKKRKAVDSFEESMQDGRKTISLAKVSQTPPHFPKPSFKIGDCIRRAASQMTGSPSILKSSGDKLPRIDGGSEIPAADGFDVPIENFEDALQKMTSFMSNYSSLEELLSQLHEAACDPMKSSFSLIVNFFSNFRDSIVVDQNPGDKLGDKRKKSPNSIFGSPETFEFEDMNDTYWTDRIVQNGSEEQLSHGNGRVQYQIVPVQLEKPLQKGRKSRKRYSDGSHDLTTQKPPGYVDERAPAELVMNFTEINSVPSETKLNKMFKHFGPLKESETEVDRETSRARVVFRRSSDAEVAYNSAGKFNIFGPVAVNYQLNYTISESFKASLYAPTLAEDNPLMSSSLCGDHALVASTLGEETSHFPPSLGEEASFMVSTLGEETLPIATSFHEELHSSFGEGSLAIPITLGNQTSGITTSMYEETLSIATNMYEETLPIATSMYEETLPITTTAVEGTMDVATTIGDQTFMVATTVGEQFSTVVTTISEQTSMVVSTYEEAYPFSTTLNKETSTVTPNLGAETSTVNVSLGEENSGIATEDQETSSIPSTFGEETPAIPLAEETPSIPGNLGKEAPAILVAEETASIPRTLVEESPTILLAEETPSIPRTLSEETPTIPLAEETPGILRTLGEETSAIPETFSGETPAIPPTSGGETPTIPPTSSEETRILPPTFNEETSTIPITLGQETQTTPSTMVEETMTIPATLHEETSAILTTLAEENPTTTISGLETPTTTNLGDETPTSPTTFGEESSTIPTTLAEETATIPTTLGEEASTVLTTNGEETSTVSTTTEMELSPPKMAGSKEHST